MCGIVGVISKSSHGFIKQQLDIFHQLLYVDNFRGDDSTGIFMVDRDGDLTLAKSAQDASDFQKEKEYDETMRAAFQKGKAMFGHNRKATKGTITDENAHPFVVDKRIVLIHNGTLYGDYKKFVPEGQSVEVDSHAIAHLIHKHEDDVEAAAKEIQGAYTLVWFDMKLQTLNMLRNSQRPLAFMETADAWYFASEKNMLEWMVIRHNLVIKQAPTELGEGVHVSFKLPANGKWEVENNTFKLPNPHVTDYEAWKQYGCGPNEALANGYYTAPDEMGDECIFPTGVASRGDREGLRAALAEMEKRSTPFETIAEHHVRNRRVATNKGYAIRKEEEGYAVKNGGHISAEKFLQCSEDFIDQNRYPATCFDYTYANGEDALGGYMVYARLDNCDNFMCRTFVPPEYEELKVTDMTANARRVTVKINGRAWRKFENAGNDTAAGNGYGIFFSSDIKRILTIGEACNAKEISSSTQ